ncbi:MAG TPA: CRTAC1 family protein [Vicinamibacterales bacterium]|nr:CRTAC1 family protein [Vicinamibacterales bacterium]
MTRRRVWWLIWTLQLVAALLAVHALNGRAAGRGTTAGGGDATARFGFRLQQVNRAAGVDFVHEAPTFDPQLAHIMPQIASTGASVSVVDFDRDGWQDFYVTTSREGGLNRLYRNQGNGTFVDIAGSLGIADVNRDRTGVSMGAVWGDYDNDGYEDVLLYKYGRPELFHNRDGKGFDRVTERAGLPPWVNANAATWLDYDRDGHLDLFITGYFDEHIDLWHLATTRIMPESFEYANNGGRKFLLRNRGDGTFEDVTARMGITSRRWTLAVAAGDLLGTGYPDLFLANDYGVPELFANDAGRRFVEVGRDTGLGMTPKSGMNASFGDIFNDGRLAIYKTNISEPGVLVQGNDLWMPGAPAAGGGPGASTYENLASSLGVDLGGWSWGAQFGDLNNDGTQDLYVTNGYVSAGERSSYWYDFAEIAVGHSAIIGDAKNWPDMKGRSLSGYQRKRVWVNDGLGRFTEVAQVVGASDTYDGRAVALADLGNRGVLDVLVANQRGPLLLYRNDVAPGRHWIAFDLTGACGAGGGSADPPLGSVVGAGLAGAGLQTRPRCSNRSAIGARVELQWGGRRQTQEVLAASGFAAENQRRLHFGLGAVDVVDRAIIRWPSGLSQTIDHPRIDTLHQVTEPHAAG